MNGSKEYWKQFWNEFAIKAYDYVCLLPENRRMLDAISSLLGHNKKILDAGCGTGNLVVRLAKNNEVIGIDFSHEMLKAAMKKTRNFNNVSIIGGDVTSLEFEDKSFDAVVSVNVFFNLNNPEKAISEANRVLKDNGTFTVSCPLSGVKLDKELLDKVIADSENDNAVRKKIMTLLDHNKFMFDVGGMKFIPTEAQLSQLLQKNGFKILKKERVYYDSNILIHSIKA